MHVVCPYCYIGFKHLTDAVQKAKEKSLPIDVQVTYTPFILRRHLPKEGVEKLSVFKQKFGGDEARARSMFNGMKQSAADAGICMNLDGQRAGNSEDLEVFLNMVKAYNCE